MNNKKIFFSIFLIFFFVSIAAVSANDNSTDLESVIETTEDIKEIEVSVDDAATVSTSDDKELVAASDEDDKVGLDIEDNVYFDASAKSDGDGTSRNPFKYVTPSRLPYGCTAYFANGVYEISSTCKAQSNDGSELFDVPTKVTFYGESTDGVIFKCVNSSAVAFKVLDNSRLYAYNMTFDNAVIENHGRFEAYGVVFKNGIAIDTTDSYYNYTRNNAFGGAIYSPGSNYATYGSGMKSYLTLQNCIFMNNRAVYGGSIYHKYGNTIIKNTKFIDSYASLYGGVLATDGGDIVIENCEFVNCHAAGDAGGAIYSKVTNLTVKNSNFTNGYGDFGGAICNLNSDLIIENSNFYNNSAKLEGGAIYVMYGNVKINNCNITLSSARDGGAIFEDNCTSITIKKTNFDKSSATRYGGIIFSNGQQVTLEDVELGEGSAAVGPAIYHQDKYDYDIGYNADYELMRYNSSYAGVLPSRYDLREEGYVTPVRDQQAGGNCWAFAGIAALESCIYKATGKSIDLSEENVKNLVELYSAYGWKYDTNNGGHSEMTWGHLISWLGPVLEEDDVYDDYSTLSTLFDAVMHVQNVYYLPVRQNALDNNAIKKAIMDYGGISVGIYWDDSPLNWDEKNAAYYLATSTKAYPNHAVCIVGWDDNYNKNNFPMGDMADSNGAWIVKNSWGKDWGDNGYFYVSYYDPVVYAVGEKNDVFTFILNETVKYNRNYQYDIGGMTDFLYPEATTVYYKNTFTALGNDILSAFSTVFEIENDYEAKVYINNDLKLTQKGHSFAGYATIPLNKEFQLTAGDKFTIEIKVSADSEACFPICEVVTATRLTYSEGISFFSTDGKTWKDLYTFTLDRPDFDDGHRYASQVACIKAFTRSNDVVLGSSIVMKDISTDVGKLTEIKVTVKDENNKLIKTGYVTFDINGKKESVKVIDGTATLKTTFDKEGKVTVLANFDGGKDYKKSSTSAKVTVLKASEDTNTTVPEDNQTKPTENTTVPEDNQTKPTENTTVPEDNQTKPAENSTQKELIKTVISGSSKFSRLAVDYSAGERGAYFYVVLKDVNGKVLAGKTIQIALNGKLYKRVTNKDGKAGIKISLAKANTYNYAFSFQGDDKYDASKVFSSKVTIVKKKTTISAKNKSFKAKTKTKTVKVTLKTIKNKYNGKTYLKAGKKLTLKVKGKTYTAKINKKGVATFKIKITKKGKYTAKIKFAGDKTYKASSKSIKIKIK